MKNIKLGIIGGGNMAGAILNGIIRGKVLPAENIIISDLDENKLNSFKKLGVNATTDNVLLLNNAEYIILAVKPQVAKTFLPTIKEYAVGKKIISIMAGISILSLKNMLGDVSVTRIMPNTPCLVGEGMCAVDATDFDEDGKILVFNIFNSLGKVIELPEKYFHAVTAVSGSGPAYVYMFIKAMINGGINSGLDAETSKLLTLQTFRGAASMVENSDNIDLLIKNVCSPGGTTIEAVNHYNQNSLEKIIVDGMKKCKTRSEELSSDAK